MSRAINPCARTVKPEEAYEVWQSSDEAFTYFVLKKYQSPEKEAKNPYARWYCLVTSPFTSQRGEYGDVYVAAVTAGNHRIVNPLKPPTDEEIVALWKALRDVPLAADEDGHLIGDEETTDQDFFMWPKGTPVLEIWQWFDERYSGGLAALMSPRSHQDNQTGGQDETASAG